MSALIPAAEALAILRAAGVNAQKSPARGRCRTLCYLVAGQYVNLGRLRELAREALAAQAEPAPAVVAEPEAVARLGFATFNPETEGLSEALPADCYPPARPRPVLPGEAEPPAPVAQDGPAPVLPNLPRMAPAPVAPGCFAPVGTPPRDAATLARLRADATAGRCDNPAACPPARGCAAHPAP